MPTDTRILPRQNAMLNLHALCPRSRANGPGVRMVLWLQGCTLGCPGCFNPATHLPEPRSQMPVEALVERIVAVAPGLEGITVSGGEPLQQPEALLAFLAAIRLFSAYTWHEIERLPLGPPILTHLDVLIAGRYVQARHLAHGLRGSTNQTIHLLSERYTLQDLEHVPPAEVSIEATGTMLISGIDPPSLSVPQHE